MNSSLPKLPFWALPLSFAAALAIGGCATHTSSTTTTTESAESAETTPAETHATAAPATQPMDPVIARIRDEGLNHSKVMDTLDYLCDVIGQRFTGSPQGKKASAWTRDTLASWGLSNAHTEAWGPFGRGWEVKRFSMQVIAPYTIVLTGYPRAWSPGFDKPFEAPVVYLDATDDAGLEKFKGKLKGAVVMIGAPRETEAHYQPLANRMDDESLEKLAAVQPGTNALLGQFRAETASERRAQFAASGSQAEALVGRAGRNRGGANPSTEPTTAPSARGGGGRNRFFNPFSSRALKFAADQGAAVIVSASTQGDGGTFFVQSASIPGDNPFGGGNGNPATNPAANPSTNPSATPTTAPATRPRVWSQDAPKIPAQVTMAVEDYNRVVRMIQRGEQPKMAVDFEVAFHDDDPMSYNTVAEIPGTDPQLQDQIVMVGAHLDSWHSGTGATDNGVGSAAAMEAIRIIKACNLKPRRTIRVALWTGEEEGLFGSQAYVKEHFGYVPETPRGARRTPTTGESQEPATQPRQRTPREVVKGSDYEKLSVYFNLDNGTGKIRGIYAQGNAAAVPLFKNWLAPFGDLGAKTITMANTGSTDHISFDTIGLPGFQFIQDPIEYSSRTHHSNEDVYDRIQADDMKQASTIMAAFLWNAANMDDRFPRKPLDAPTSR